MSFRFNAKRAFLTYPRSGGLTKERVLEFLRDDRGAAWYCVGLEQHEDGGDHLHAYAEWVDRINVRDATHYFDVDGHHPNFQPVRNKAHVLAYVQKGGDYCGNMAAEGGASSRYGDIVADATGARDFLERVIQHHPRDAVLHLERIKYFAAKRWPKESVGHVPRFTEFEEPLALKQWREEEFIKVYSH